jgi:hypothetical protein
MMCRSRDTCTGSLIKSFEDHRQVSSVACKPYIQYSYKSQNVRKCDSAVGSALFNSLGHPLHQVHIFWLVILYIRINALFQYFRLKQQNVPYIYETTYIISYLLYLLSDLYIRGRVLVDQLVATKGFHSKIHLVEKLKISV